MQDFEYIATGGRVIFGAGSAVGTRPRDAVDSLGATRVMAIVGEPERELADRIVANLATRAVARFEDVREQLPLETVLRAREMARAADVDCLLSIGGGWTTGTAKAVALELRIPIIAIPTTYAGSEVTPFWLISEPGGQTSGRDAGVVPRVAIYDPLLTLSLSREVTVTSSLNAVAHAAESLWSPRLDPVTALHAEESIRALVSGMAGVLEVPSDLASRATVQYGAWLAGMSAASAGSGMLHRTGSLLSGAYRLPRAATLAVLLPYAATIACRLMPAADGRIAAALGTEEPAATALFELSRRLGAPASLAEIGLTRNLLADATERLVTSLRDLPNPIGTGAVHWLLHRAWHGVPPLDDDAGGVAGNATGPHNAKHDCCLQRK